MKGKSDVSRNFVIVRWMLIVLLVGIAVVSGWHATGAGLNYEHERANQLSRVFFLAGASALVLLAWNIIWYVRRWLLMRRERPE